jgi:glycosyltransferase involved in cell wall biosynthesis
MSKVAAIIPCFNHGRYLAEAVESVLAQTYSEVELVVVNDGSTDDTKAVASSFGERIRYLEHENRGLCASRNRAIEETESEYIAFLDADDRWQPEKLARQIPLLEADPRVGLVHTDGLICTEQGVGERILAAAEPSSLSGELFERLLLGNPILGPSVVARRSCLDKVGLFDENLGGCGDWDLWLRICRRWKAAYVAEPLLLYRRHTEAVSMSEDHDYMLADSLRVLDKAFADPELPPSARTLEGRAYSELYFVFGKTCLAQGRRDEARAHFARAVRAWPGNTRAARYWIKAAFGMGGGRA